MQLPLGALINRRIGHRHRRPAVLVGGLSILIVMPVLGYLSDAHEQDVLIVAGAILLVGVLIIDVGFIPVLAVPCTLLVRRVGGGTLSLSDLVLAVATVCALTVFSLRDAPEIRRLLRLLVVYQATTLLTVIYNPYRADITEWVHEAFLVGGSLVVGWVVGRNGKAKPAVTTFVLGCALVGVLAGINTVTHHFRAANLSWGFDKNYIGDMLAFGALLLYARPEWLSWRGRIWHRIALVLCLLGIISAQSKQAIISLVLCIAFLYFRNRGLNRRSRAIFVFLIPMAIVAYSILSGEVASHNKFNGVYTRISVFSSNFKVWDMSRLVGVGLRWWYQTRFTGYIQPPNAEMEMLTSAGLIGLAGFVVLVVGAIIVLRKVPKEFGTLALVCVLMRIIQGQFDVFWVGAQGSLPWMIPGIILGVMALKQAQRASSQDMPPESLPPLPIAAGPGRWPGATHGRDE